MPSHPSSPSESPKTDDIPSSPFSSVPTAPSDASEKVAKRRRRARSKVLAAADLTDEELRKATTKKGLLELMRQRDKGAVKRAARIAEYELDLQRLQIELVKLQRTVQLEGRHVAILFEGRDAAGKGGAIRRFIEHLNPRTARVIALPKPSDVEQSQWYFQRYVTALPNAGEITFFDRSWYNRAVVEPVMNFCTKDQYQLFMRQVPEFEHMLYEDGIELIKFWFSISKEEQAERFESRRLNPLKQWKISPVDEEAQEHWDLYTHFKTEMFARSHTTFSPWIIVKANSKRKARLESIRYVLHTLAYTGEDNTATSILPDPGVVRRYHRSTRQID